LVNGTKASLVSDRLCLNFDQVEADDQTT